MDFFERHVNPHLGSLLRRLNMDKSFVRGEGCYLFDQEGEKYLDFIAAYGALPFGYNPREIWEAVQKVYAQGEPSFCQPSFLTAAGELAELLVRIAPGELECVTFTNSGAEAVEAGIKLCRSATGRKRILAAENSFHGKTLGALSATGQAGYQEAFGAPVEGFEHIPFGDLPALERVLAERGKEYAALILEPVQGEGGIVVPPQGYLSQAHDLCRRYGVLLVLDEIQTGLGRTGTLFACQQEGVFPDVLLLAKALGGGLLPIGACLSRREIFSETFGLKHSSTFAGNSLACRAGIAALELLLRNDGELIREVEARGQFLGRELKQLQERFPHLIASVRGRGLMWGLEFTSDRSQFPGSLLGVMVEQEMLAPVFSSHLLNVERLRVAPTLNGNTVIRLEPALVIAPDQCRQAVESLEKTLERLEQNDTARFLGYLVGRRAERVETGGRKAARERVNPAPDSGEGRFAFLIHPVDLRNYPEFDRSLTAFNPEEVEELTLRWSDLVEPFVVSGVRLTSEWGCTAYGEFIAVPRTAQQMRSLPRSQVLGEIRSAIQLGRERGARMVGLGAFTSVVSRGGLLLRDTGAALTTGNSFTVVSAVEAVSSALDRLGESLDRATVAVVGATGSIGRAVSLLLAEEAPRLILVGNPERPLKSRQRLLAVAAEICRHLVLEAAQGRVFPPGSLARHVLSLPGLPPEDAPVEEYVPLAKGLEREGSRLVLTLSAADYLPRAEVVITATSSLSSLVTPSNVKFGALVCDLSRPSNVSREIAQSRRDVLVIDGGVIALPGRPDLGWDFGFEPGLAYACMAETMMLALEQHYQDTSLGPDLNRDTILWMRELAWRHGFGLADLRSFDRPLEDKDFLLVQAARERKRTGASLVVGK